MWGAKWLQEVKPARNSACLLSTTKRWCIGDRMTAVRRVEILELLEPELTPSGLK
jgi:hypothetical protein